MAHKVTVVKPMTTLPNGGTYPAEAVVVLTDEQFAQLAPNAFDNALTDGGAEGDGVATSFDLATPPAVTGVTGGNAALESLLSGLAGEGLVTDSTTSS